MMSMDALYELQERLNSAAIAGVHMLGEDFRLKRAIEQFSQTGAVSPVFQKIAQQLQALLQVEAKQQAGALMDVIALIDAVLYTQGTTQINGELESIVVRETSYVPCRYSDLQPLQQALTDKGAGRYEIVRTAYENKSAVLRDFRLRSSLIAALGDSYSELADLVKSILAEEEEEIIPLLKDHFDPKGKREMARRVEVIEQIAKHRENEFYLSLLDNSSSIVREAAVHALKHDPDNTDILIQLAESERGAVKTAAYSSLSEMKDERAEAMWLKHAMKNPADVENYLDHNCSDALSDIVAAKLEELIMPLLQEPRNELEPKEVEKLQTLLRMIIHKSSDSLIALFDRLADSEKQLSQLRDKQRARLFEYGRADSNLLQAINLKLIESMISGLNPAVISAVERLVDLHNEVFLHAGFAAALLTQPAEIVYEQFAPMLRDEASFDIIAACFSQVQYDKEGQHYYIYANGSIGSRDWHSVNRRQLFASIDDRWIELLTTIKQSRLSKLKRLSQMISYTDSVNSSSNMKEKYESMLMGLINPHNENTTKLLYAYFQQSSQELYTDMQLYALYQLGHREFHELLLQLVQKVNLSTYQLKRVCDNLQLSREEEIIFIRALLSQLEHSKARSRYLTPARLQAVLQQLESGEEVMYW